MRYLKFDKTEDIITMNRFLYKKNKVHQKMRVGNKERLLLLLLRVSNFQ